MAQPLRAGDADCRARRLRVLAHVRDRLGDDVVRRRLDPRRQPLLGHLDDLDRDGRSREQGIERRAESALGEDDGMDAARQFTQLGEPLREILLGDGQDLARGTRVVLELAPDARSA